MLGLNFLNAEASAGLQKSLDMDRVTANHIFRDYESGQSFLQVGGCFTNALSTKEYAGQILEGLLAIPLIDVLQNDGNGYYIASKRSW